MSNWSRLNNVATRSIDFFWKGESLGSLSPAIAKLWQEPQDRLYNPSSFEEAFGFFEKQSVDAGYRWAIGRLAQQNQSKVQLKQKLKIRGLPALLIEAVMERLEQAGALDEAYLTQSLEEKAKRQHRSLRLSKQSLSSKGLTPSKLEWKEAYDLDKENALYWLKRWSLRDDLRKKPERYWARLATRGFDFAPIQEAWSAWIKEYSDENSK